MTIHLEVRDLRKEFVLHVLQGKRVLGFDGLSFDVPAGAFIGVAGSSGSGKSSLLKCIFRTYRSDAGSLTYRTGSGERVDLASASDDDVLDLRVAEIGYVSQFLRPNPRVQALDLAARPLYRRGIAPEAAQGRMVELFTRLQLPRDLWDGYPVLFSGGEQQRVNLARALAAEPRLLLLDEPTSSLNPALQQEVVHLLREARDRGTTLIGVMHDTLLLRDIADVVLTLDRGRLVSTN